MYLAANNGGNNPLGLILLLVGATALMWLFLVRPQQKRRREMEQLQSAVGLGDEVLTMGGLYGRVVALDDETVTLEVSPGVTNRYVKGAIGRVVTPTASDEDMTDDAAAKDEAPEQNGTAPEDEADVFRPEDAEELASDVVGDGPEPGKSGKKGKE